MGKNRGPRAVINGFSVNEIEGGGIGLDGQIYSATLYLDGKKLGRFHSDGSGADGIFVPEEGVDTDELETRLHSFPVIPSGDEAFPDIHWNIEILIEKLISLQQTFDVFRKARSAGMITVSVHSVMTGIRITFAVSAKNPEKDAMRVINGELRDRLPYVKDFEIQAFQKSEDDFRIVL